MGKPDTVTKEYIRRPDIFADVFNQFLYHGDQKIHTFDRSLVCHFYVDIGVFFVKMLQVGNQKIPADGIAGPDADLPAS